MNTYSKSQPVLQQLLHFNNCLCPSTLISEIWPNLLAGLALYFMDVTFRMAQWRITSGMQCTFVSADRTFVSIKLKYNKACRLFPTQASSLKRQTSIC